MAADLALADANVARKHFDEELIPLLRKAADFRAPVFYLVTTRDVLRDMVKNGWTDPENRYRYNRAAEQVSIDTSLDLTIERMMNDQVLAVLYDPPQDLTTRRENLGKIIRGTETQLQNEVAARALFGSQSLLADFIGKSTIEPLQFKREQQWFGIGVIGIQSTKYLSMVSGIPEDQLIRGVISDDPRNPVRSATVNLLSPTPVEDLRPAARGAYVIALQTKSAAVMKSFMDRAGRDGLPKVIKAIRAAPPADGPALVKIILDQTGIDLTRELLPR
jgi:hypothetical protein